MPNFNFIGSRVLEPPVAENRYLPLTRGIALTTVYAIMSYTVIILSLILYLRFTTANVKLSAG